jgi:hypothetical protein
MCSGQVRVATTSRSTSHAENRLEIHLSFVKELAAWALRRRERYRISGDSMAPMLQDGDVVLLSRGSAFGVGDVIVSRHPYRSIEVVKYVGAIEGRFVRLDSPGGDDSAQFGRPPVDLVVGPVTANLSQRRILGRSEAV